MSSDPLLIVESSFLEAFRPVKIKDHCHSRKDILIEKLRKRNYFLKISFF